MTTKNNNQEQPNKLHYDFYEDDLWLGRFPSIINSIDANLKLLRIILLTKGSSITQFGSLISNKIAEGLLSKDGDETLDKLLKGFSEGVGKGKGLATNISRGLFPTISETVGDSSLLQKHSAFLKKHLALFDSLREPDFEVQQLYNLRTLSLDLKDFVDGRLKAGVTQTLQEGNDAKALPEVDLIRKSFQHVATDAEIIQRAIVQRVHEVNDKGKYVMSMQAEALLIMDKLALDALAPFKKDLFEHLLPSESDITPITYFSQKTHIHRVPYSDNIVLIGIRYDQVLQELEGYRTTAPPFELLAIPHEVGHYIYLNAEIDSNKLIVEFGDQDWWKELIPDNAELDPKITFTKLSELLFINKPHYKWCEEIFADICGCIVAGPLAILGMQSLLASRADEENHKDDEEHPTGILRPFIFSEIMEALNELDPEKYDFKEAADKLGENWELILGKLGHTVTGAPKEGVPITITIKKVDATEKKLEVTDDLKAIREIIDVFAKVLLGHYVESDSTPWTQTDHADLKLYNSDMEKIAGKLNLTARQALPPTLAKTSPKKEDDLKTLIDEWEIKGPINTSTGT